MNLKTKLIGPEDERAVSPVIGVILMVAITVILAAVIAAFVLDLGQSQSASATAGVDFDQSGDEVTVQIIDQGNTEEIYVRMDGEDGGVVYADPDGSFGERSGADDWSVGDRLSTNVDSTENSIGDSGSFGTDEDVDTVTVIGVVDNEDNVIQRYDP